MANRLDIVNSLTAGRLAKRVGQLRDDGLSFERIAERVRLEFDIPTTTVSVHRWWTALEAADPRRGRAS